MKILKFGAKWCAPCKVQDSILEQLQKEVSVEVEKIDIEKADPSLLEQYNIKSIPVLIFKKKDSDEILDVSRGLTKLPELIKKIDSLR